MREVNRINADLVLPDRTEVLRRIGVDDADRVSPRLQALVARATALFARIAAPVVLFERLQPVEIGVTLAASCLMNPLKSVSGVLVAGPARVHRFRPTFPFCDACATHACRVRMASVP